MTSIEIVSHCYAVEHRHYADALCYQLSSLILYRPRACEVTATVCCVGDDRATQRVLSEFVKHDGLRLRIIMLPDQRHLGRRSIGRNMAAKGSVADLIWFADVDMVFGGGCLEELAQLNWHSWVKMVYPQQIKISKDHATGDRALRRVGDKPRLVEIDPVDFVDKTYNRAIGGVQIVRGDFAREHGYLNKMPRWQRPADKPFGDFHDDVVYRKFCMGAGGVGSINLPEVCRLRHSTTSYQ